MKAQQILVLANQYKNAMFFGRYILLKDLVSFIETFPDKSKNVIGKSVLGQPIYHVQLGKGKTKVLMWSQMHGNETTTTKALIDFMGFLQNNSAEAKEILSKITFTFIPMLNPDGANSYTRVNANKVDLNRDAQHCSQPESAAFKNVYTEFEPDFCFNLHDQRTIFGVGEPTKPATVSFLSPAFNQNRDINSTRSQAMQLIVLMSDCLQEIIPNQIGRYDDGFNLNCVGDTLQNLGISTLLFEAGHYKNDYEREKTRGFIFVSLIKAVIEIANQTYKNVDAQKYFDIPENKKCFYDVVIRNCDAQNNDLAIMYKEILNKDKVHFLPFLETLGSLDKAYGHQEIDVFGKKLLLNGKEDFSNITEIQEISIDGENFLLNLTKA